MLRIVLVVVLAFPVVAESAASQGPDHAPNEAIDETYLAGYLTWTDQGRILWGQQGTAATGGPASPQQATWLNGAGWTLRSNTANRYGSEYVRVDTFRSEPLPQTVFLNVSRSISLFVCWTGTGEGGRFSRLEATIHVGGQFLSGGLPGLNTPPLPWQYTASPVACHNVRMHAELDRLPAGSELVLEIRWWYLAPGTTYAFRYNIGSNPPRTGASVLHLPTYPDYELALRHPEPSADSADGGPGAGTDAAASSSPPRDATELPWLTLALFGMVGRARRPGLAALVLLGAGLAGCLGGASDPAAQAGDSAAASNAAGGNASVQFQAASEATGNGSVVGQVRNPFEQAVVGARVSLLDTGFFSDTGLGGKFLFRNVPPGTYGYRVEAPKYRVFEGRLDVVQGNLTRVLVTLDWLDPKSGDAAPHRHDRWIPETTLPVLEKDVVLPFQTVGELPNGASVCYTTSGGSGRPSFCIVDLNLANEPGNPLILPGASSIEAVITWSGSTNTVERAGLAFVRPGAKLDNVGGYFNTSFLYPRKSGEPTHIQTNWDLTDNGHALYSAWRLYLYVPLASGTGLHFPASPSAQVATATFHVKIEQHKGLVPLEPGHQDWWRGNSTLLVLGAKDAAFTCPTTCTWPRTGWVPESVVPADAVWLEIVLEQTRARPPNPDWSLLLHPAGTPPKGSTDYSTFKALESPTIDGLKRTFRHVLAPGDADGIYAEHSGVIFALTDRSPPAGSLYLSPPETNLGSWILQLKVVAHRDPAPAAP